jgi:A/G-specific adenine glycosylase
MLSEAKHLSKKEAAQFRRRLSRWYQKHGRDLPWRRTRDPYAIFISEVMLQQTQVATVIPYYERWLRRFPNIERLAAASEANVLHAWQGLGYYARARNLHAAAKVIVEQHSGRFPTSIAQMRNLPGIGKYTAHAVATFAFDQAVPIIEANTGRLLARIFDCRVPIDDTAGREFLWSCAASLVPKSNAARFNSALVDLGALVCIHRRPKCAACPVKTFCRASNPELLPVKRARPPLKHLEENHALIRRPNEILLERAVRRWRGMWMLPPRKLDGFKPSSLRPPIHVSVFPFTNHRVILRVFRERAPKHRAASQHWFPISKLDAIPIPTPHRRALNQLLAVS